MDEWKVRAACREAPDKSVFFPERATEVATQNLVKQAKAICKRCPVRRECLDYALEHYEKHGVWGGTTERERRKLEKPQKPDPRYAHGTPEKYRYGGCRCLPCSMAWSRHRASNPSMRGF
jgi:WhiB family redox-sensing transcriptional regulator